MIDESKLKEYNFEPEYAEEAKAMEGPPLLEFTGYPQSALRYRLHVEGYNISIEEPYFWVLHYLEYMQGFAKRDIIKITDIFSAAENSAFFGASWQRIGLQQDKVSQFLATIGKMVKELFQLVRELRVLDERLGYYADSYTRSPSSKSAEITLKGIWIDMVEQGAKNPASVYGMSREVQFTTLPDLFFDAPPMNQEDVDIVVEQKYGQFNRKVREVLVRKLRTFVAWKQHTFEELKNRRIFTLKYLRQHYEIIKMYMDWVKPYLKNLERLRMDQEKMKSPELLVAFETSILEVEILATKLTKPSDPVKSCILCHFLFRTRPEMSYQQEGYQRGPIHVGRIEMAFRAYAWDEKEIENYIKMKKREDFELLGLIDASVKAAMESLGDELMRYLSEAGEDMGAKKTVMDKGKALKQKPSVFKGFQNLFLTAKKTVTKQEKVSVLRKSLARSKAQTTAVYNMWNTYHHFKKHHAMLNW